MKTGIFLSFMSPIATPEMVASFGKRVEAEGLDSIWLGEHVVLFDKMEFPYPGSPDGRIPVPAGGGLLDTISCFNYLAALTKRIRFGTGIALVPQRNPIYSAKEFATLDWLSNGRFDLGIGVGWCKEEVIACGYEWETRGARCDEFLEVYQKLWTEEAVTYHGTHIWLDKVKLHPKPVQKPHVPIIVGGHSDVAFRRAARFGAGWYGFGLSPAQTKRAMDGLATAMQAAGRSRGDYEVVLTPPYGVTPDQVRAYKDLGVDRMPVMLGGQKPDQLEQRFKEIEPLMNAAT